MLAVYFHMNTCDIQVFEASWKKNGFKTLKSFPLSMGCLFLYPVQDNENTWQDLVFRAQATTTDNWLLAWSLITAKFRLPPGT